LRRRSTRGSREGLADIRSAHGAVFEHVRGEGSRLTELAASARLTNQSVQYLVDDLERRGDAERIPDPADRRAKLVRLSPCGRAAVLVARDAIADVDASGRGSSRPDCPAATAPRDLVAKLR
jgi:DNA-binding MarR family transcriptional regulator